MSANNPRRNFIRNLTLGGLGATVLPAIGSAAEQHRSSENLHSFNQSYTGEYLRRLAFPIGGIGAGMFCIEGCGAISHMSVRHKPQLFNEPTMFAAVAIKGGASKVIEGPVPEWKIFGRPATGNGAPLTSYGLPRFVDAQFEARFPFGILRLQDDQFPFKASVKAWSPFIPGDADNSSLPAGAMEYSFENTSAETKEAVFSYNSRNFMTLPDQKGAIQKMNRGFVLSQPPMPDKPFATGDFALFTNEPNAVIDYCWFRGGWWDPLTMLWNTIKDGTVRSSEPVSEDAPGASIFVPFTLRPGEKKTIAVLAAWYVPYSDMRIGDPGTETEKGGLAAGSCNLSSELGISIDTKSADYRPWYASRFSSITDISNYWLQQYNSLLKKTEQFTGSFYKSSLPAEVMEAVAANLTILKTPTVMRQYDGRLWNFEGSGDDGGCCHGSCTHVWNYAQAIAHLFPSLERSLRHTEFCESQNEQGHQNFRSNTPISPAEHKFHAAADGQLGGIMKVYREWRISGDTEWLKKMYPLVQKSLDYCIKTWDPKRKGILEEPHHNTYDIEFWGPDGMCTSFYLGALDAFIRMGNHLKKNTSAYQQLFKKGKAYMETDLYNGEYFIQKIQYKGLEAPDPVKASKESFGGEYSKEAVELLEKEGPKYQYGTGCLSDGVLGGWIARMCGLPDPVDSAKLTSHLLAVHTHNLKKDLSVHANPQRPAYAVGKEGGLLLCSWPKGGKLSLPFVYSDEVWTGIEYQVASHLMLMGKVKEGLEIVRICRERYSGKVRNPFNEYECGSWYGRALSSYGLLQGLTGLFYDAVDKTLYIDSKIGDFTSFISTESGFGTVEYRNGKVKLEVVYGNIPVTKTSIAGLGVQKA